MDQIITFIALGVVTFVTITVYNRLVALFQYRKQAFSDIDIQLKQRHDLIPALVETVKGFAKHEKGTFAEVTKARASAMQSSGQGDDRVAAETGLNKALMNLMMVSENYPDLKADMRFKQLQDELSDMENKIAASRRFFNSTTAEYNSYLQQFPAFVVAWMAGFKDEQFLEFDKADRDVIAKAPDVKFA